MTNSTDNTDPIGTDKQADEAPKTLKRGSDARKQVERPHEDRAPPVAVPEVLTLEEALRIATECNRDYKTQRDAFFAHTPRN